LAVSGAGASVTGAEGASCTGADARDDFCAACFLGEAGAAAVVWRGDGNGAFATGGGADARGAVEAVVAVPGSGLMMLMGGVEAAEGKSALVGLPVGIDGGSAATTGDAAGAFQLGA
jgi:hypothetical protein